MKHKHVHLALGNIPNDCIENIDEIICSIWNECDFSNNQKDVKPTYDPQGWLNYEVKDVEKKRILMSFK